MTRTIRYRGPARGVGVLAHMLSEEGVDARFTPPVEQRSVGDVVEVVVIYLSMKTVDKATDHAMDAAVKAAIARFRQRFGGAAQIDED